MGDGRGADAALGTDKGDRPSDRIGFGIGEQTRNRAHQICKRDRRDHVFGDARADQLAVKGNVVVMADDDDAAGRIADIGQFVEPRHQFVAAAGDFNKDQIGRGCGLVEFDGCGKTAHVDARLRLRHPPVFGHALDGRCHGLGLAERLHGNARHRPDLLKRIGLFGRRRQGLGIKIKSGIGHVTCFRFGFWTARDRAGSVLCHRQ